MIEEDISQYTEPAVVHQAHDAPRDATHRRKIDRDVKREKKRKAEDPSIEDPETKRIKRETSPSRATSEPKQTSDDIKAKLEHDSADEDTKLKLEELGEDVEIKSEYDSDEDPKVKLEDSSDPEEKAHAEVKKEDDSG
ncbi:hypothetical protein PG993_000850 [Apiospora rasikravindrae]|uniref:Uncharacterized protein n=1 Tax=Apiospora rasikravindrae TaxID=990691 RepID=A0ABR1UCF3_9PEZI